MQKPLDSEAVLVSHSAEYSSRQKLGATLRFLRPSNNWKDDLIERVTYIALLDLSTTCSHPFSQAMMIFI